MYDISVVITTKNRVSDLKCAVKSVLMQTFTNYELIIVNDNSSDGTAMFLKTLASQHNNIHINNLSAKSKGGNYARNIGIGMATTNVIAMLDDDDIWYSNKLKIQYQALVNNSDCEFVYTGSNRIIDREFKLMKPASISGDLSSMIFKQMICLTSTMMFTKRIWQVSGKYDENLTHWQDYEFTMRVFQHTIVECVREPMVDISVNTKNNNRLSNQYKRWQKAVGIIKNKHSTLIQRKKDVSLFDFDNVVLEDSANRQYSIGDKTAYRQSMYKLWKRKKNVKYLIRSVLCLSAIDIQKIKAHKFIGEEYAEQ